jgi:N-acyl-D-aspartate/D-glutamate deacylase
MFGLFKKRIPAPQHEREALAWRLYRHRCETDPSMRVMAEVTGQDPMDVPTEMLMAGSTEASILTICEQFYTMRDQGSTEEFAVKTMNEIHASLLSVAGEHLPQLERASTFFQYLRHYVDTLHGHGAPITDAYLIDAIQEIKSHYKR